MILTEVKFRSLGLLLALAPVALGAKATLADFSDAVATAGEKTVVRFSELPMGEATWKIRDYAGAPVSSSRVPVGPSRETAVAVDLPPGFYEISFDDFASSQGLYVIADRRTLDPFFAIDGAMSWLTPAKHQAEYVNILAKSGIGMIRERLSWKSINPRPDHWDWESGKPYDSLRKLYAAKGVNVLEMFHDAPTWLGANSLRKFPTELNASADSWTEVARHWGGGWGAIEVWNEPDISFGGDQPADQLLPLVKAIRYSMQSSGNDRPMIGGAFAYLNRDYMDLAFRNGLLDVSDALSFHYYGEPLGLEGHVAALRALLKGSSKEEIPLWITEVGAPWVAPSPNRPDVQTQQEIAQNFAMLAVESSACGIDRHFAFVLTSYGEGEKNFGMFDPDGGMLRQYAAYITAGRMLSGYTYAGDLRLEGQPEIARMRVFTGNQHDKAAVIVLYAPRKDGPAEIVLPFQMTEAYGIDGRSLTVGPDNKITITDGLAYVVSPEEKVKPFVRSDTKAAQLAGMHHPVSPADKAAAIVLQPVVDKERLLTTARGYLLPESLAAIDIQIVVHNLSDTGQTIQVSGAGLVQSLRVPARSSAPARFNLAVAALNVTKSGNAIVEFSATTDTTERVLPVALSFIPSRGLAEQLTAHSYVFALPIAEAHRWEDNRSTGRLEYIREDETRWGFRIKFKAANLDNWAYPKFIVPQEAQLDRVEGVLLRARCVGKATVNLTAWSPNGKFQHTTSPVIPADGKWHVAYVPLSSFIQENGEAPLGRQIKYLSLGVNTHAAEARVEVSDLYFLGGN